MLARFALFLLGWTLACGGARDMSAESEAMVADSRITMPPDAKDVRVFEEAGIDRLVAIRMHTSEEGARIALASAGLSVEDLTSNDRPTFPERGLPDWFAQPGAGDAVGGELIRDGWCYQFDLARANGAVDLRYIGFSL